MTARCGYSHLINLAGSALLVASALACGCGGENSATPGGSGVTCAEACARCPDADVCSDCDGYGARFRDEFESPLYACVLRQADAGCSRDWERCVSDAIGVAGERDIDRTFRTACLARRTECTNAGMGFADDPCLTSAAFVENLVTQAQQCVSKACTEVSACLHDAFE